LLYVETKSKDAAFHFSVENFLMQNSKSDEPILMLWRADECVMLGNYQVAAAEIDLNYAQSANIRVLRRSSGGGTIYVDSGTFFYTVISPLKDYQYALQLTRETVATPIVNALNEMKIPAELQGRNDIVVHGKKVSGLAQYACNSRLCSHGSLLFDTDLDVLTKVLQVDESKISSKALRSVRSRVTNLREYHNCSPDDFFDLFKQKLFEGNQIQEYTLSDEELIEIDKIYNEKYGNPSWVHERSPICTFHNGTRFEGGKVEVYLDVVKGSVASCSIFGDFLGINPIRGLEEVLENTVFEYQAFDEALTKIPLQPYLGTITKEQLLSCIFGGNT